MSYKNLLVILLLVASTASLKAQVVCTFANDSMTFCFDSTFVSTGGCSMDTVTTGLYFFSRAEDSMGMAFVPSFQAFMGDDGTKLIQAADPNQFCITIDVPSWYGVSGIGDLERVTFAIRNKPGTAFLTSSCVNNPFGYYIIKDLLSINQVVEDAAGTNIGVWFKANRDTVCMDTSSSSIESLIADGDFEVYPNPSSSNTTIKFNQIAPAEVEIRIIDMVGRLVKSLETNSNAGMKHIEWNTKDENGTEVANGMYNAIIYVDGYAISKRITVIR